MQVNTSGLYCPGCQPGDFPQPHICGLGVVIQPGPGRSTDTVTFTSVSSREPGTMRRFHLQRDVDATGVSGTGRVAEGCLFSNGKVALTWLTETSSVVVYDRIADVEKIHGHGGLTKIVMED